MNKDSFLNSGLLNLRKTLKNQNLTLAMDLNPLMLKISTIDLSGYKTLKLV